MSEDVKNEDTLESLKADKKILIEALLKAKEDIKKLDGILKDKEVENKLLIDKMKEIRNKVRDYRNNIQKGKTAVLNIEEESEK